MKRFLFKLNQKYPWVFYFLLIPISTFLYYHYKFFYFIVKTYAVNHDADPVVGFLAGSLALVVGFFVIFNILKAIQFFVKHLRNLIVPSRDDIPLKKGDKVRIRLRDNQGFVAKQIKIDVIEQDDGKLTYIDDNGELVESIPKHKYDFIDFQ